MAPRPAEHSAGHAQYHGPDLLQHHRGHGLGLAQDEEFCRFKLYQGITLICAVASWHQVLRIPRQIPPLQVNLNDCSVVTASVMGRPLHDGRVTPEISPRRMRHPGPSRRGHMVNGGGKGITHAWQEAPGGGKRTRNRKSIPRKADIKSWRITAPGTAASPAIYFTLTGPARAAHHRRHPGDGFFLGRVPGCGRPIRNALPTARKWPAYTGTLWISSGFFFSRSFISPDSHERHYFTMFNKQSAST